MRYLHLFPFCCLLWLTSCLPSASSEPDAADTSPEGTKQPFSIERLSPKLDQLIPAQAEIERLAGGFEWGEGPLWLPTQQKLIFSDVPRNVIYQWQEGQTEASIWLQPSGYTGTSPRLGEPGSNGLVLDQAGNLLLCQHGDRRVARMDAPLTAPEPVFTTVAGRYEGLRFNSPNDLCLSLSGQLFVTDPPYGLPQGSTDSTRETSWQGVYRVDPDGQVILLIDSLTRPNGIALSPNQQTLYVANSDPKQALLMAYTLDASGAVTAGNVFYDMTSEVGSANPGLPDGLKVDAQGHVWATGPDGLWIFAPSGELLGRIHTGIPTANCALAPGYLYLTSDSLLLRVSRTELP
jgi:gluconolactonase